MDVNRRGLFGLAAGAGALAATNSLAALPSSESLVPVWYDDPPGSIKIVALPDLHRAVDSKFIGRALPSLSLDRYVEMSHVINRLSSQATAENRTLRLIAFRESISPNGDTYIPGLGFYLTFRFSQIAVVKDGTIRFIKYRGENSGKIVGKTYRLGQT